MPNLNRLLTVRLTFSSPYEIGNIAYDSSGEAPLGAVPFFISLPLKMKRIRTPKMVPVQYGILPDGTYYAQARPLSNKGTCVGCIVSLLTQSQVMLWHLIQEKIQPM